MKTIKRHNRASKALDSLPVEQSEKVAEALYAYAVDGVGDIKKLSDRSGYRLRIGLYRVLFDEDAVTILAFYVGKRDTTTYLRH
jgi:mRNA interferase RelE/StbE